MSHEETRGFARAQRIYDSMEPPYRECGDDDCSECGQPLDEDAQAELDDALAECEDDPESMENLERGATCTKCQRKEDGDDEE